MRISGLVGNRVFCVQEMEPLEVWINGHKLLSLSLSLSLSLFALPYRAVRRGWTFLNLYWSRASSLNDYHPCWRLFWLQFQLKSPIQSSEIEASICRETIRISSHHRCNGPGPCENEQSTNPRIVSRREIVASPLSLILGSSDSCKHYSEP